MKNKTSLWLGASGISLAAMVIGAAWEWRDRSPAPTVSVRSPASNAVVVEEPLPAPEAYVPSENVARPDQKQPLPTRLSLADHLATLTQAVEEERDPAAFDSFLIDWLAGIDASEMSTALAFVKNAGLEKRMTRDVETRLVRQWTQQNATAALQWVDGLEAGPLHDAALESVALIHSEQDLSAAATWAGQLPEGADRDRVMATLANEALRTAPVKALELADNLPSTPANDEIIRRAAMEWTSQDPPQALQWAEKLPDPSFRAQVLSGVAIAWSDKDPVAAGRLALNEMPAGRQQEDALVSIAQRWAQQSPAAAAQWIHSFPRGDLKRAAVESVAAIWSQSNPVAAAGWKTNESATELR